MAFRNESFYDGYEWPRYISVAERRQRAARAAKALQKQGRSVSPVVLSGRGIAQTFWGKAWCDNLESYSDFANRLPRGRSYVRNGAVVDLQITPGQVRALVQGTELYRIDIDIAPVAAARWQALVARCAGQIDSLVELLQGKLSQRVMEHLTARESGLFPSPKEIGMRCSCPDWAAMCKHVAATLYGIGARLDDAPELLFVLRQANQSELIAHAATLPSLRTAPQANVLTDPNLSTLFDIDLDEAESLPGSDSGSKRPATRKTPSAKSTPTKKSAAQRATPAPKPAGKKPTPAKRPAAKRPAAKRPAAKRPAPAKKTAAAKKPAP